MKITKEQQKKGQEFLRNVFAKAWEDEAFKTNLIATPKTVIEKYIGREINLPVNVKIVIEDQTSQDFLYINIPRKFDLESMELTDEQLEVVSGGEIFFGAIVIGVIVGGIYLASK